MLIVRSSVNPLSLSRFAFKYKFYLLFGTCKSADQYLRYPLYEYYTQTCTFSMSLIRIPIYYIYLAIYNFTLVFGRVRKIAKSDC